MANIAWAYGICDKHGVDTKDLEPWEVIKKAAELSKEQGAQRENLGEGLANAAEKIKKNTDVKSVEKENNMAYNDSESKALYEAINGGKRFTYQQLINHPTIKKMESARAATLKDGSSMSKSTEERRKRYAESFLNGAKNVPKDFRADIVLGLPGAGKSTGAINAIKNEFGSFEFDNDEIKKLIDGYDDGRGADYVHKESKNVQDLALNSFLKNGKFNGTNIAIPIVGSDLGKVEKQIDKLKTAGYNVHIHYVHTSNSESINRVAKRAIETGRYVPLDKIAKYGNKPQETFNSLIKGAEKGGYTVEFKK